MCAGNWGWCNWSLSLCVLVTGACEARVTEV